MGVAASLRDILPFQGYMDVKNEAVQKVGQPRFLGR
jgi:hypothetical protein